MSAQIVSYLGSAARRIFFISALVAGVLQIETACNKQDPNVDPKARRGRQVYFAHCIACHNPNPAADGSIGPAIKGSSLELLQARVLRAEYPPGYSPKRPTKMMPKLPLTEENIADVHAFLNQP